MTLTADQEAVLEQTVRDGRFRSKEEAASAAFASLAPSFRAPEQERVRTAAIRSTNLAALLSEYPWAGAELHIERDKTPLRDLDL